MRAPSLPVAPATNTCRSLWAISGEQEKQVQRHQSWICLLFRDRTQWRRRITHCQEYAKSLCAM